MIIWNQSTNTRVKTIKHDYNNQVELQVYCRVVDLSMSYHNLKPIYKHQGKNYQTWLQQPSGTTSVLQGGWPVYVLSQFETNLQTPG